MRRNQHILLIDGDEGIRNSLSLFLGSHSWVVDTAENGTQAFDALQKKHYVVVLCDELLPDTSGIHLLEHIYRRWPEAKTILFQLYGNRKAVEPTKNGPINGLLTKPFTGSEVEDALLGLLGVHCRAPQSFTGKNPLEENRPARFCRDAAGREKR